jgi:serine/arginine repetitive matrix protein 2
MDVASSPDPLNDSPLYIPAVKTRQSSRVSITKSLPLRGSSPKKQTFQLDLGNELSPQKIRVTVEAEDLDENHNRSSSPSSVPASRRRERTTTTTIPLKGLSDNEEGSNLQHASTPKRGRGRPRKSVGTPIPSKKRASTPSRKSAGKRRSVGELVDGDDTDDMDFRIGHHVETGKGKGKSRSRSTKGSSRKNRAHEASESLDEDILRGKGRNQKNLASKQETNDESHTNRREPDYRNDGNESSDIEPLTTDISPVESTFSTIQSSTVSGGEHEPNIVIARFDPGNETPRRPGWSSPRIIEGGRPCSSRQRADSYPSPSVSPTKSTFSDADVDCQDDNGYQNPQYEEEGDYEEEASELREFDTILESEGFSMISVDSVPSLREHLSSPTHNPEKQTPRPARHESLLALQEKSHNYNDSFSEIPQDILEAATPAPRPQNGRLLSVQNATVNDSFSSIPPNILEAATPARPQQKHQALDVKDCKDLYENSFSAGAPSILDSGTPAAVRKPSSTSENLRVPGQSSNLPSKNTLSPRLLTPEETPSPPEHETEGSGANREAPPSNSDKSSANEPSLLGGPIPSSPPSVAPRRYTYSAHLRSQRQLNVNGTLTPSIVFSSPSLPPPLHPSREQLHLRPSLDQSQRPTLSPIARAGRVLQDILVPSSPRSRSQSLGSPFKSPAGDRRSSSVVPALGTLPVQDRLAGPLPRLDLSSHFPERSPQRPRSLSCMPQEDPFQNNIVPKERMSSTKNTQPYVLDLPHQRQSSDPRFNIRSETESLRSEDAMSWQADETTNLYEEPKPNHNNPNPINPRRYPLERERERGQINSIPLTGEQKWAAQRDEVRRKISSADPSKVVVIESDDEASAQDGIEEEDFGLLLETLNSSSPAAPQQNHPVREAAEKPRRSKLPSPWRQNSKRLVYSDEISHFSSPEPTHLGESNDHGKEYPGDFAQPATGRCLGVEEVDDSADADLSGWQIPQKSNFNPRARETGHLDLSALLSLSPAKQLPVLPKSSTPPSFQKDLSGCESFPSDTLRGREVEPSLSGKSLSTGFTPIPQKMGFNPRVRDRSSSPAKQPPSIPNDFIGSYQTDELVVYPSLGESPPRVTKAFGSSSLSRTNTLSAHYTKNLSAELSSLAVEGSLSSTQASLDEKENRAMDSCTIKWTKTMRLPPVSAPILPPLQPPSSPVKSCLRSPMKTPNTSSGPGFPNSSPSKGVAFVSSSPVRSSPSHAALSSTTWSKGHWVLLDEILQTWKSETMSSNTARRRRNSTRVISRLLGKKVRSQGESMVFEQWHLEAVDEFRGVVPGWEEKIIAMRLFSLILAADRRERGLSIDRCY